MAMPVVFRWGIAAALVVGLHAGIGWSVMHWDPMDDSAGDASAIAVDLAPMTLDPPPPVEQPAPPTVPETPPVQPDPVPEATMQPVAPPPPEPVTPTQPVEEARPEPVQETQPDTPPQPAQEAQVDTPLEPEVKVPDSPPVAHAEAVLPPVVKRPRAQPKPVVRKVVRPRPTPLQPSPIPLTPREVAPRPKQISPAAWQSSLQSRLRSFRRPVIGARGHGTAIVSFSVSRSGQAVSVRVVKSSGDPAIDNEAKALVLRASPLPVPPDGSGNVTMPVYL